MSSLWLLSPAQMLRIALFAFVINTPVAGASELPNGESPETALITTDSLDLDAKDSLEAIDGLQALENNLHAQATTSTTKNEEKKELNSFSATTQLTGQVIFGLNAGIAGDISRNTVIGQRTRLELLTTVGGGTLTMRLQSTGLGSINNNPPIFASPEGTASFTDGDTTSAVKIDLLKYDVPIGPNTQLTLAANAAGADDFTDSINPYFDGDGGSGSISRFGNRPAIYYLVSGAGAGIRHKLNADLEGSVGYLANNANNPANGAGLTNGSYGAIAQLTYLPNEKTKVALTYVNAYNTAPGVGSNNANPADGNNNMFGIETYSRVSNGLALGAWVGFNKNSSAAATRDIFTWAVTAAFPDLGAPGNLGGLVVGQEPRVTGASGTAVADPSTSLHLEGFYQIKVNDNLAITPGLIYLTAPDHNSANKGALIGTIRTTFSF